jgi:hypothetical protein
VNEAPISTGIEELFLAEQYFAGRLSGYGIFFGPLGKARQQFTAEIEGKVENEVLLLEERLTFQDGRDSKRLYRIQETDHGKYSLSGDSIVGPGTIEASKNTLHWKYRLKVLVGKREVVLAFDDWMYLQPDGVVLNRAWASKFGIPVGQLFLTIHRKEWSSHHADIL